ncbi:MAG: M20/M25/M40 family metallo-hydrolase [Eubacteriales bacterium]|nr:M20/M25/M40 family metallo-hydrolase [Eubacteriales bacterium]
MFYLDEYLKDLTEICAIDSGRLNKEGTHGMVEWFKARYDALGFNTEIRWTEGHDEAPLLFVSNLGTESIVDSEEKFDVLFISHLDTVFDTETVKGWPVTIDDEGYAHGPGVIDCKGGSLLEYYLLKEMKDAGELKFKFVVAMNSDEEGGSKYSKDFFETLAPRSTYCLVFEPGRANDQFVGERKGGVKYIVKAHGIGAHSGADFEKGANAIVELAKWIPEITALIDLEKGTTINVAKFEGGLNNGQVPDYAEANLRLLYLDPAEISRVDALIERMKSEPFDKRCSIEVEESGFRRPPMHVTPNSKILFAALDEAGRKTGVSTERVSTGGMSDGNWVSQFGVGTLDGCGPSGDHMHTINECMKIKSVPERFNVMRTLLNDLFKEN